MGVDSESLVHFFRISFQRMHKGMEGDETTFTKAPRVIQCLPIREVRGPRMPCYPTATLQIRNTEQEVALELS